MDCIGREVTCFKETKFRYINLEQDGNVPELLSEDEDAIYRVEAKDGGSDVRRGAAYP